MNIDAISTDRTFPKRALPGLAGLALLALLAVVLAPVSATRASPRSAGHPSLASVESSSPAIASRVLSPARAAGAASVNDTGHLHLLKAFGAVLIEEGPASGTLPGRARVRMVVGASVSATFTIAVRGGSISGSGRATLHSSGRYSSFGGTLTVTKGSGRYARARGGGKLYGVIDRRSDAVTVQTVGTLRY